MIRLRAALLLASASLLTGGCVAAAIPVVAGGIIARDKLEDRDKPAKRERVAKSAKRGPADEAASAPKTAAGASAMADAIARGVVVQPVTALPRPDGAAVVQGATELPPPTGASPPAGVTPPTVRATKGEDAALSLQAYQALWTYLATQTGKRQRGEPVRSVVLDTGATLAAPRYATCDAKPLAILFDIDEDPAKSIDPDARWRRWKGDGTDPVIAVPGAVEGIDAARREGVTVIFSSARSAAGAAGVASVLERLGFGRIEPGKTLQLRGEAAADGARQVVAAGYCVIALIGDSLDDFSDLFAATAADGKQPAAVTETMVAPLWGAGWFLLPNPVRGTATASSNPSGGN